MTLIGPSAWRQYAFAAALAALATLARAALFPLLGPRLPFIFGFPAVALAAWLLPFGPALAALAMVAVGGCLFTSWPEGFAFLPFFLFSGGLVVWFGRRSAATSAALAQSEAQFRELADAMPQIVWITRPDGHHEYYNRRWYDYVGGSPEETVGHGWNLPLHPEDRPLAIERWRRSLATGEAYEIEYRFRAASGEYRWFLGRALPVRDADGRIVRWFGTCTDIHDMRLARQGLQEAQEQNARLLAREQKRAEQLRKLADASLAMQSAPSLESLLGVITGEAKRAIGAQQAFSSLPLDGDWARGLHATSFADSYAEWRGKAASPDGSGLESLVLDGAVAVRLTQAQLESHPANRPQPGRPPFRGYLAAPFVSRSGRGLGVIQISDRREGDFTEDDENVLVQLAALASAAIENVRLYDALRDADKRKDEFLATLAHELRNPLAPVRTGLQVLRLAGPAEGPVAKARAMMDRQVSHLVRLIDDLLDLSRINKGRINIRKESCLVADIVADAVEAARLSIDERRQSLETRIDGSLRLVADPIRLVQVVGNLLANASRYTPEGGHILVEAKREGDQAVLAVSDDGIGVAADMLERIFDMFAQERNTEMRSQGGLGIGLTLVRGLVELHGGQVTATSAGRGKGSTFTVRLPAEGSPQEAVPALGARHEGSAGNLRVLVVDDNHDSAESLAVLLRLMGQEVRMAHDGPSAVEAAASFAPALVLLDIGLPGLSGLEVARRLRQTDLGKKARLIAMTGYGQEEDRRRSMEAGFDRHLVKPIDPDMLEGLLAGLKAPG